VPFLGKTTSVGFNFCTRERPFTLAVVFLGGGGWFGIRIGPDKLQVLELGLEAGACLSVDLGVASGSISAMIGIYMRLEGELSQINNGYEQIFSALVPVAHSVPEPNTLFLLGMGLAGVGWWGSRRRRV
jgi:hypothetical protein